MTIPALGLHGLTVTLQSASQVSVDVIYLTIFGVLRMVLDLAERKSHLVLNDGEKYTPSMTLNGNKSSDSQEKTGIAKQGMVKHMH
jgi:hypothetical protein